MSVKKIFVVLITIVVCVVIGALVINVLLPNVATGLVNSTEEMILNATGMGFDFNGDGVAKARNAGKKDTSQSSKDGGGKTVAGFNSDKKGSDKKAGRK